MDGFHEQLLNARQRLLTQLEELNGHINRSRALGGDVVDDPGSPHGLPEQALRPADALRGVDPRQAAQLWLAHHPGALLGRAPIPDWVAQNAPSSPHAMEHRNPVPDGGAPLPPETLPPGGGDIHYFGPGGAGTFPASGPPQHGIRPPILPGRLGLRATHPAQIAARRAIAY
jgi:hypothetical protein